MLMKLGEIEVLQLHQVSSKSDEKQKRFIISPFFCSEFQSVSRIVKIVHSGFSLLFHKKTYILFPGALVLDDCDTDTYGLEQAVDFIKGKKK